MIMKLRLLKFLMLMLGLAFFGVSGAMAQDVVEEVTEAVTEAVPFDAAYGAFMETQGSFFTISNLWLLISAALVFVMHLGFSTLEAGLCQSKNTVNILFKNVFIICMGVLTYAFWGFNAMYPGDAWSIGGVFAMGSWFDVDPTMELMSSEYADYTWYTDFIFQAMFAATAATIVSGAVAERVKLSSFMIFATLLVMFAYPVTGSWEWGGGWLNDFGVDGDKEFIDFAGSSLVHAFGGYAALACVLLLGARKGKYLDNGKVRPILGHSMPLATIGVFLLFLGWFGFNGGSVLSADPYMVSLVFVTTALAACAGGLGAMFTSWIVLKKPDLSMSLNGVLAGLVGITAGADTISPFWSIIVGLIAGIIVVISVLFFDKIKIDDPVGAISVHGICGNFGTIVVGICGGGFFMSQLIGTIAISAFAFIFSIIVFGILKVTIGVRVSEEEEMGGLDIGEHGQEAYPDFAPDTK
ncbi:ammonium transporter [Cerasicoccus arenae]|uniref:Ammonium transporter n=1 Tax=Cerasicoccus arenae TaxID=424488 RepID=A0A8J3DJC2_9BACT|nr:ammonium transporter [Cerasicoccus arenae]